MADMTLRKWPFNFSTMSQKHWGLEVRGYDQNGRLILRSVLPPGVNRYRITPRPETLPIARLRTRPLYFDEDGRPDWTLLWEDMQCGPPDWPSGGFYQVTLTSDEGPQPGRWVTYRERLLEVLAEGLPQPWRPEPMYGEWPPTPRAGLMRFGRPDALSSTEGTA